MHQAPTNGNYAADPTRFSDTRLTESAPPRPIGEYTCSVVANDWVNNQYKILILAVPRQALAARAGQFFNISCPTPDELGIWVRRPMSIYKVDETAGQLQFLYKCSGRGTLGLAALNEASSLNIVGPLGRGFALDATWSNIVVLGRGVGLATLAPLAELASREAVDVTALLSSPSRALLMSQDRFRDAGAEVIEVFDADGTSSVDNVDAILAELISQRRPDAFFTCGSNRLLHLLKRLGREHNIPGQVAIEQIMACGLGPCYICVKTFEVNGEFELRRVCRDGPVFDLQEAVNW